MVDEAMHRVERLGADGDGVVRRNDALVFVRGALPGDLITLGSERKDGRIQRAELARVIEASPDRVPSACDLADRCGGCPLMAASPALETAFKTSTVAHALRKGGADVTVQLARPEPLIGYRTRARLHFEKGTTLKLGYLAPGTRTIVDAARCAVLTPVLNEALRWAREKLPLEGEGELHLGSTRVDGVERAVLGVSSAKKQPERVHTALREAVAAGTLGGAELTIDDGTPTRFGTHAASGETSEDVDGRVLRVGVGGFRQAHARANQLLGAAVLELGRVDGLRVLELHAGHGNFTLALAARAAAVEAVELASAAVAALRANLKEHGLRASVHAIDDAKYLSSEAPARFRPEVVVLDPPRTGAKDAIAPLCELAPARIVYVSCSPITLGRDLAMLAERGYRVTEARAFDLFPHTTHVETVVLLERLSG